MLDCAALMANRAYARAVVSSAPAIARAIVEGNQEYTTPLNFNVFSLKVIQNNETDGSAYNLARE